MKAASFDVRHIRNPAAARDRPYSEVERRIISRRGFELAYQEISSWPGYEATPLIDLTGLNRELGIASLHYKDEGERFDLKSFKALGGAYAVLRVLKEHLASHGIEEVSSSDLVAGRHRELTEAVTVTCATDGNHGRSVAWGASMFGCRCIIYLHSHVSHTREQEIAAFGAEVTRVDGNYDESVRQCARDAAILGRNLVADTNAAGGDPEIPAMVMQGYTVMAEEVITQLADRPMTHVFVQGGVGGLAAALAGHLWETMGVDRPRIVVVEPTRADCIYRTVEAGRPTVVPGDFNTFMACLAAGEISPLAWPILQHAVDDVITLGEKAAPETMRLLAKGVGGDPPVVSGESGCAAVAGLIAASLHGQTAAALDLGPLSHVVAIGSEGATDAAIYRDVVGESAEAVARRAA